MKNNGQFIRDIIFTVIITGLITGALGLLLTLAATSFLDDQIAKDINIFTFGLFAGILGYKIKSLRDKYSK